MTEAELAELWARRDTDRAVRDQLILLFQPLVESIAGSVAGGLPANVDRRDLVAYGVFGLIESVDRFDPERGVAFEPYALQRIRGSITDGLRGLTWAPKTVRARARDVERARGVLQGSLHREPTDAELAGQLGVTEERVARVMSDSFGASAVSLEVTGVDVAGAEQSIDGLPIDVDDLREGIADAVAGMPARQRVVFILYYVEQLTFERIGVLLGVRKVRVSQLRDEAVLYLRERIVEPGRP